MAGGVWRFQNKIRPGAYIRFVNMLPPAIDLDAEEIITLPINCDYGESHAVVPVARGAGLDHFLYGYDDKLDILDEAFKRAKVVLLYRLNGGEKATAYIKPGEAEKPTEPTEPEKPTDPTEPTEPTEPEGTPGVETFNGEGLEITARYPGALGNKIQVTTVRDLDDEELYKLTVFVDGDVVFSQMLYSAEDLKENPYITLSGTLSEFSTALSGGTTEEPTIEDYMTYFEAVEPFNFKVMAITSTSKEVKNTAVNFITRLRDEQGEKRQLVVSNVICDHPAVTNVTNGVILEDDTVIPANLATVWVAGASASCPLNKSLTYTAYDGAKASYPKLSNKEIEGALLSHEFIFTDLRGRAVVEMDINTHRTPTKEYGINWSKNDVVRTMDYIANDSRRVFEDNFIGQVPNTADGREGYRADRITFLQNLVDGEIIEDFDKDKVIIEKGEKEEDVVMSLEIKKIGVIERLYMTVGVL